MAQDRKRMGRLATAAMLTAAMWSSPAAAAPAGLDQCSVIVTGTDQRSRAPGMARCLTQVLMKVSGDATLADDPRVAALGAGAEDMVEDFVYFDRMSDVPLHDEQGSRDRPFDLVVNFDPARIDQALAGLDRRPWRSARPVLLAEVAVQDRRGGNFVLSADGSAGEREREALFAAAALAGLRVVLLPAGTTKPANSLATIPLNGTLRWSDADFGWVAEWTLTDGGKTTAWNIKGVSFDEAFRSGLRGAAGALSRSR